jgi:hypothetical protein
LILPAGTRRFPAVVYSARLTNDPPAHNNRIDLIAADSLILVRAPSNLIKVVAHFLSSGMRGKQDMKFSSATAALLVGVMLSAQASAGSDHRVLCTARVLHSEELPFAPIHYWLVKVTLEVTPPNGTAFITTLQESTPWQVPPPRRGQTFRLRCDPANPGDLHLTSQTAARTAF